MELETEIVGWIDNPPKLDLDHREFSYAGKFVMTNTGKAVVRKDRIVGAVAFNEDRKEDKVLWIRYITVHKDERGNGIGPRLADFVSRKAFEKGYEKLRIAVNNPFAYEAMYDAGFVFTGKETGIAELILERTDETNTGSGAEEENARYKDERYAEGLESFLSRDRDLSQEEREFVKEKVDEV